ncbi:Hypothetical protein SMAX5B_009605 [Scophthalmus maximus]|uniref:Uncharacterized protein n=1 Tax=Scophthalmus maximus TaxID=52904 RepID=A0A2U9C554_SCOMX|nr:Hypothetical protein SMAX5B_009605 [Scophthalmus maximus]
MERVDCLAEYLVGLRTETGQTLNNQQASTIIALWQNLLPYDQQRVTYAARHQAVDERCVPGMERVDCLAEYLVGLRTETGQTLNNQQASTIIALWQNLLPYDQQRVTYAARHQDQQDPLLSGQIVVVW